MEINLELYKNFYYVGKYMSFSEAAKELYISQSAVSQSIKALEEKLDIKLFVRHTKKVKFTSEGEALFDYIKNAFHFIHLGENFIASIHTLDTGEVKIAASDTICKYYLLSYIKKFHEAFPNIKIQLINKPSPLCANLLYEGKVDLAVVNVFEQKNKDIKYTEIKKIQDVFIAGKSYKHLKNVQISLKNLENYPFLSLKKNSTTRNFFEDFLQTNQVSILPEIELESIDLLIELTKIGLGISFVMEDAIQTLTKTDDIFILNVVPKPPSRSIGILTHKKIPLSTAARNFLSLLIN
ncbi:LysR family transcriptional regulator [Inediibacterium massiliense]|uniref:LysR family transcriptional regulator n=1 Tax=Inediibacterium massiliense TaxID=1658111 RepID=UPI0006B5AB1D|nr:LysR family transcriptional regulator [Inediibacterium massiliense]